MAEASRRKKNYKPFEKDIRVTVSPKTFTWPDGGETTYIPAMIAGSDSFVELVCRGALSRTIQKSGVDIGWTMRVKGVILPTRKNSRYRQVRVGVNRLTNITRRKALDNHFSKNNSNTDANTGFRKSGQPDRNGSGIQAF